MEVAPVGMLKTQTHYRIKKKHLFQIQSTQSQKSHSGILTQFIIRMIISAGGNVEPEALGLNLIGYSQCDPGNLISCTLQ